jgi:hypothetical protein
MRLRGSFGIALASVAAVGCGHEVPPPQAAEAPLLVTDVRLTPSVDAAARRFGRAMAASDDGAIVVIGAPDDSVLDPQGGAAHVFTRSVGGGYTEAAVLRPSVHGSLDQFGAHVAISADGARIAVGAPGAGVADTGAVFVFSSVAGVWTEEAALSPMGAQNADEVSPVALDGTGTTLLVGSPNDSTTTCTGCGAAFVFVRSGSAWTEEAALLSPAPAPFEKMGWAVSLSRDGSRAFVGVPREDTIAVDAGAARTFTRSGSTWTHEALLQHSDAVANDLCGLAIVSNAAGDRVAVGCPLDDTSLGANAGTVRVFTLASGSWSADSSISITDGQDGDQLGFSVALTADGRRLVAGAPGDDVDVVSAAGSARVFDLVGASWREGGLARPTTLAEEAFGRSVAIASDGVSILAGGDAADTLAGADAGGAWALVARGEPGESCGSGTHCASGFCADGVCCDTACGGGVADDCQACVASLTGGTDGRCAPLDDATAPRTVCRAVAGDCDVEERCVAGSTACPTDTVDPAGTACRVASGACDLEERCDGAGPACPADALAAAGTECRAAAGVCDVAEACDGAARTCPADRYQPESTSCADGDVCNGLERCTLGDCVIAEIMDCDDDDLCTADACDATSGCSHTPIADCCRFDFDCIDADSCTEDTCDATIGACMHSPIADCTPSDAGPIELPDTGLVRPDGGPRDGAIDPSLDAGTGADTGAGGSVGGGGCGCRVQSVRGHARHSLSLGVIAALLILARRTRRRGARPRAR